MIREVVVTIQQMDNENHILYKVIGCIRMSVTYIGVS